MVKNREEPTPGDHKLLNSALDKAVERFKGLEAEERKNKSNLF